MGSFRAYGLMALALFSLTVTACGSSEMTPEEIKKNNDFWAASSLRFSPEFKQATTDSGIVSEDPAKPTTQVMVRGEVQAAGYAGGAITLEVRVAEACADGYCPVEGKSPLASTVVNSPGFFSLVVPSQGQKTTLVASASGKSGMLYLGELSAKVDGVEITLK
ncbi:MAG: hypothetical protein K8R69_04230 [Deltaproteobacteria bacterium]|nr:hypothetical protein [Deltaproteobacteria bacterium]